MSDYSVQASGVFMTRLWEAENWADREIVCDVLVDFAVVNAEAFQAADESIIRRYLNLAIPLALAKHFPGGLSGDTYGALKYLNILPELRTGLEDLAAISWGLAIQRAKILDVNITAGAPAGIPEIIEEVQETVEEVPVIEEVEAEIFLAEEPVMEEIAEETPEWVCSCGEPVYGRFCPECGNMKPDAAVAAPAVESVPGGSWTCSCGTVVEGRFCPECGSRKPEAPAVRKCPNCGWIPEEGNAGLFCIECGTRIG